MGIEIKLKESPTEKDLLAVYDISSKCFEFENDLSADHSLAISEFYPIFKDMKLNGPCRTYSSSRNPNMKFCVKGYGDSGKATYFFNVYSASNNHRGYDKKNEAFGMAVRSYFKEKNKIRK